MVITLQVEFELLFLCLFVSGNINILYELWIYIYIYIKNFIAFKLDTYMSCIVLDVLFAGNESRLESSEGNITKSDLQLGIYVSSVENPVI